MQAIPYIYYCLNDKSIFISYVIFRMILDDAQ